MTLAIIEEFVENQGTAWQNARSELGRMYERVLAEPTDAPLPALPAASVLELSRLEPPEEHRQATGAYRELAMLLGKRTADLHLALSQTNDPSPSQRPSALTTTW